MRSSSPTARTSDTPSEPAGTPASERNPDERHGPRMIAVLTVVMAVAGGLSALVKVFDPDVWWYVRVGQWMWEHRALPVRDPFSFTGDLPYGSHPVLTELIFFFVHAVGGVHGLVALNVALVVVIAALALRLGIPDRLPTTPQLLAATSTLALWFAASSFRLGPKPELFTYVGLGVVLLVLRAEIDRPAYRALWALPLAFVFWGNLHRGGVMALGLLGAATLLLLARAETRRKGWRVGAVVLLAALCLCANPSGIGYFTTTFSVMSTRSYSQHIAEWAPISVMFLTHAGKWFSVLAAIWAIEMVRRRRVDTESVLALAATVVAFKSLRLVPIAALMMVPACARLLTLAFGVLQERASGSIRRSVWVLLVFALGLGGLAARFVTALPSSAWGSGVLDWRVPVDGVRFVQLHPPPGVRMWNNLNYGGYLLYALGPTTKVFIDGRNDMVYAPDFFNATQEATSDAALLRRQLEQYSIDFAVVQSSGLIERRYLGLFESPDFVPVYMDDLVTVMVRNTAASQDYLRENGYRTLRPHTAVQRAGNIARDPQSALFEFEANRNVEQAPNSIRAWYVLALLERARARREAYERAREVVARLSAERGVDLEFP